MDQQQHKDILHGVTLETVLNRLLKKHGWEGLYSRIRINCFAKNPSVKSSLIFLRKTPWARAKVENLYMYLKPQDRTDNPGSTCPPEQAPADSG